MDPAALVMPRLRVRKAILPYADLDILGDFPEMVTLVPSMGFALVLPYAMSESGPRLFSMTPTNALRVANVGAGSTHIDPQERYGFSAEITLTFGEAVDSVLLLLSGTDASIEHSYDGQTFDSAFHMFVGETAALDVVTRALRVTPNPSGPPATLRAWGLYHL